MKSKIGKAFVIQFDVDRMIQTRANEVRLREKEYELFRNHMREDDLGGYFIYRGTKIIKHNT